MSDTSYVDYVLSNWYLDPAEIYLFLDELNDHQWNHVCNNRESYANFIRFAIDVYDPPPVVKVNNSKYVIRDLTDYDMFKMNREKEELYNKKMMAAWKKYKEDHELRRPILDVDTKCDQVYLKLQEERLVLEAIVSKRANKYTTPAKRNAALPKDKEYATQKAIVDACENEFKSLVKKVELEDVNWEYRQRIEFEEKVFSVQKEATD